MRRIIFNLGMLLLSQCFWGLPLLEAAENARITPNMVYGHADGTDLILDMIKPEKQNGAGILLIQSAGWFSIRRPPEALLPSCQPYLDQGYTMFIVHHGNPPKSKVPDAVDEVRLCARFIRLHAKEWGIDPERLGAFGGSAGAHLSLMLATTGDDGNPNSKDEVLKQSSRIAVAVALAPPTDLRQWVTNPPEAIKRSGPLKLSLAFDASKAADVSPLLHVTAKTAPSLLIHGDKDDLVPISHSESFLAAMQKEKVPCRLIVIKDGVHASIAKNSQIIFMPEMIEWFDKYLAKSR